MVVAGIMEHIEEAGIHSGDSACSLPPRSLTPETIAKPQGETKKLARALEVGGLMNVQYALKGGEIYVLEVNPRASRTVPFVAKVIGKPIAAIAAASWRAKSSLRSISSSTSSTMSGSRKRCFLSPASPASTPCWGRKCVRPAK